MKMKGYRAALAMIVTALVFVSTAARAGYYYEAVTTTDAQGKRRDDRMTVFVWVEGDATKIQMEQGNGDGLFGPGSYIVTKDAGELMYLVNTKDKTWAEFNLGQMMDTLGQAMEGMGGLFKIEFTNLSSEQLLEEPGGSILGRSTKHLRFRTGYTMKMAVMGIKRMQIVEMIQDMWLADGFDTRAFSVWLRPDKRLTGMFEGLDEIMETTFGQVDGVPLKTVVTTKTTDKKGRVTTSVSTTEVTTLREESVPPSTFEFPADYTETQVVPDLSQIEGQQSGDAKKKDSGRRPRLKDLFKRKGN